MREAHLKLRRFLLVVGSLAREAKISSRISSLCFSYLENTCSKQPTVNAERERESWGIGRLTALTRRRELSCRAATFSTKKGNVPSDEI